MKVRYYPRFEIDREASSSVTPPLRQASPPSLLPFVGLLRRPHLRRPSPPRSAAPSPAGRPSPPWSAAPSSAALPRCGPQLPRRCPSLRLPAPPQLRILRCWSQILRRPPPPTPIKSSRSAAALSTSAAPLHSNQENLLEYHSLQPHTDVFTRADTTPPELERNLTVWCLHLHMEDNTTQLAYQLYCKHQRLGRY